MNPYKHVWLVLWKEQDTERSGVHGVFTDEDEARRVVERANCAGDKRNRLPDMAKIYRAECWPIK